MMPNNYLVQLEDDDNRASVSCDIMGVSQTGDLIAFNNVNGQPFAVEAFAAGTWKHFKLSTVQLRAV